MAQFSPWRENTTSSRVAGFASVIAPQLPNPADDDRQRIAEQINRRSQYARACLGPPPVPRVPAHNSSTEHHSSLRHSVVKPADKDCNGETFEAETSSHGKDMKLGWHTLEEEDPHTTFFEDFHAQHPQTYGVGDSMKERLARASHLARHLFWDEQEPYKLHFCSFIKEEEDANT